MTYGEMLKMGNCLQQVKVINTGRKYYTNSLLRINQSILISRKFSIPQEEVGKKTNSWFDFFIDKS